MDTLQETLSILHQLSEEARDALVKSFQIKTYPKNTLLVSEGDICKKLYFIEKGLIRGYYIVNGKEITAEFTSEWQFITGINSFYNQVPAEGFLETLEDTKVHSIHYDQLQQLYNAYSELNYFGRKITEQNFVRREKWSENLLCKDGKGRYLNFVKNFPELYNRVPLNYLATYLGMTKEHLSRIRTTV